ncbi:polysaccharide deacetylase family protein [Bradyrhizobium sp. dw_411]|uniref:polysaccharide deacetylase family protein n=1 Tax=Bradyrhizobium sp. dw_411 TaxID=2720082 RepID=UPI001BCD1CEB|nr:polysaccharide deacetylase family protein [Bradyrhizobium sp. dw_411]
MIGRGFVRLRTRQQAALSGLSLLFSSLFSLGLLACISAPTAALAEECPGHPDAIGTSRTLVVDPREHRLLGTMQYRETLPLADHEVVLTFDDGPLPRNSNQILEILASQCVKATFFTIGRMAQASPEGVRKLRDAGHTIGTHTQNHPLSMNRMPIERAQKEIDDGIASVKAALGDDAALAPFLRIPGLLRADAVEDYARSQGLQIWSADFPADDWRHISPAREYDLAINRIEAKGKGILLLHDIQARTVAALPRILNELKARGYHIVHVVPATPDRPATPTEPQQWLLHPPTEDVAISHWPKIPNFAFAGADMLPVPALADFNWLGGEPLAFAEPFDHAKRPGHGVPRDAHWPQLSTLPLENAAITLPAPEQSLFEMPDGLRAALQRVAVSSRHVEPAVSSADESRTKLADTAGSRRFGRGKSRVGHGVARNQRHGSSRVAGRGTRSTAPGHRGPLKHLVQVKKRHV